MAGIDRFRWLELPGDQKTGGATSEIAPRPEDEGKNEQDYLREADQYYRNGYFEEALRAYSAALKFDSRLVEAWAGQVRALTDLKEYHEAGVWVDKALGLFSKNPLLLSAKAWVLAREGRLEEALQCSDQALGEGGEDDVLWLDRGTVLLLSGNQEAAVYCLNKLLEREVEDWYWLMRAGMVFLDAGMPARAQKLLQMAVEHHPDSPLAWLSLAAAHRELGQKDRARECLERLRELDPRHPALGRTPETQARKRPCLVASCCFRNPGAPQVLVLRRWRDRWLLERSWGRGCARFYDRWSPRAVQSLVGHPRLKALIRLAISGAAALLKALEPGWNISTRRRDPNG